MKCYDFELNISAFIEGELKQVIRKSFVEHKENCELCNKKLIDITHTINKMAKMKPITTSPDFTINLNNKINIIDNRKPSIWERLINVRPLGFDAGPALGFVTALIMIIGASYLLIDRDKLPQVQIFSSKNKNESQAPLSPSVIMPAQPSSSIANSDSLTKSNVSNRYDGKIKLTGAK